MKKILPLFLCLLSAFSLQAQTFHFPDNYNTNFPDVDNPTFEEMNGEIYFFAAKNNFDYEPHKYSCATGAYTLLKDVNPGAASSEPYTGVNEMMKFKTHVYFGALDGTGKTDLWRTDGTGAGTVKFKSFAFTSSNPQTISFFAADENLMYFRASTDAGYGIWRTDGTDAGTFLISQATNFNFYVSEKKYETLLYNGKFYFQQKLLPAVTSLPYATDGTLAGTVCLIPAGNPDYYYMTDPYDFEPFQGKVWFGLDGPTNGGLFKSDGTLAGTQFMGSCGTGANPGKRPNILKAAGDYLYVRAMGAQSGYELFYTDGTLNGGGLVSDLWPGPNSGLQSGSEFFAVGDKLFFTGAPSAASSVKDLYVVTGTSAPIRLDISGPTQDSKPQFLVSYNNLLYFRAKATSNSIDQRVYQSDGTVAGTVDAAPGASYYFLGGTLQALPSGIYFPATIGGNDLRPATIGNCFMATGVSETIQHHIELFPNPIEGQLNFKGIDKSQKICVQDLQGRKMLEKLISPGDGELDCSELPSGMYVVCFENGKREKVVRK
ncbi:MAG TPA: T9SS type A sorting domain-containing protein [Catalimonadaceae bacterium]|nr:T9SS type A sorting domain-containing protein [Catalimonadaceae bacterium]